MGDFKIERYKGKGDNKGLVKSFVITNFHTSQTSGGNVKIDPKNPSNLAMLKGALDKFPTFAGAIFNTHLPVYLRAKISNKWRGTFIQALQIAEVANSDSRSLKAQTLFKLIENANKEGESFESGDLTKKGWKKQGFDIPPTDEEIEQVKSGDDPWAPESDSSDE